MNRIEVLLLVSPAVGKQPGPPRENLVWAPFKISQQHGSESLKEVLEELRKLDRIGADYDDFVEALRILGQKTANRGR